MAIPPEKPASTTYVYDKTSISNAKDLAGRYIRLVQQGNETVVYADTSFSKWIRTLFSRFSKSKDTYANQEELKAILKNIGEREITPESRKVGRFIVSYFTKEDEVVQAFTTAITKQELEKQKSVEKTKKALVGYIKQKYSQKPDTMYHMLLANVPETIYFAAYETLAKYDALNERTDKIENYITKCVLQGVPVLLPGLNPALVVEKEKNKFWDELVQKPHTPLEQELISTIDAKNMTKTQKFDTLYAYGFDWQTKTLDKRQFVRCLIDELFVGKASLKQRQEYRRQALEKIKGKEFSLLFDEKSYKAVTPPPPLERGIPPLNTIQLMQDIDFPEEMVAPFAAIDSTKLADVPFAQNCDLSKMRDPRTEYFLKKDPQGTASTLPITMRSPIIPKPLVPHLLFHKREMAIGSKFQASDKDPITNVEGIYSLLRVQLTVCHAVGDIIYQREYSRFTGNQARPVIVSTNIHPDYEFGRSFRPQAVMWQLTAVGKSASLGEPLPHDFRPLTAEEKRDPEKLADYEELLLNDLIYQTTQDHKLPALSAIQQDDILSQQGARELLERIIKDPNADIQKELKGKFIEIPGDDSVHSLEVLFSIYVHQLRNELSGLEKLLPQGYVYTIDPPSIFARAFDATAMNRLQILGIKYLFKNSEPKNMKVIGFNDNVDKGYLDLLRQVVPESIEVRPKYGKDGVYIPQEIVTEDGTKRTAPLYNIDKSYAVVIHNNDDSFGDNITNEQGFGSLDAVVGALTTAANSLKRLHEAVQQGLCWPPL
jgi:hypothetical protein